MKLYEIIEQWASLYKPISHTPMSDKVADRAFYLIDTINSQNGFVRNHNVCKSPCVAFSSIIDAQITNGNAKGVDYQYVVYILKRQPVTTDRTARLPVNDEQTATDIKYDLDAYAQDLLAYLAQLKRSGENPVTHEELDAASRNEVAWLDLNNVKWGTVPERYEGWYIVGVELHQIMPRRICVSLDDYRDEVS